MTGERGEQPSVIKQKTAQEVKKPILQEGCGNSGLNGVQVKESRRPRSGPDNRAPFITM